MSFPLPPTRAVGNPNPPADINQVVTALGAVNVPYIMAPSGDTSGSTDTTLVQSLASALNSASPPGGWIIFRPGRYYITQMKLYSGVEYIGTGLSSATGGSGVIITAPSGNSTDMVVPSGSNVNSPALRHLCFDGGNGNNGAVLVQANQFNCINFTQTVTRPILDDIVIYNTPGDSITTVTGSYGGCSWRHIRSLNGYGHGLNLSGSDFHLVDVEVGSHGLSSFVIAGSTFQGTSLKSNFAGLRGVANDTHGIKLTGNANTISGGCYMQNDVGSAPASANGNSVYISGTRNRVDVTCSGSSNALLYLDGSAVYNSVDLQCNNQQNQTNPNYIYQINAATVTNNRVRITGGSTFLTSIANLTNSGTEANNQFSVEGEEYGQQSIAYASTITPDPYLGGYVQVGTITGALTVNAPANGHPGSRLILRLLQDGTGGHTVTMNSNYKISAAIPTTLSTATEITFICEATGGIWREVARATA